MRRTNADKRRTVLRLLDDAEWSQWSDNEIAKRCGVSRTIVVSLRPPISLAQNASEPAPRTCRTSWTALRVSPMSAAVGGEKSFRSGTSFGRPVR